MTEQEQSNIRQEYNVGRVGMNMDLSMNQLPKGVLTYALNASMENFDANSASYQNEPGNELCLQFPEGYQLIHTHFINEQNKHIFFLSNPNTGDSEIGYMENNDCIYHTYINAKCLGFDINYPIHKSVHKITNCTTELYWPDNIGRRYIDLTTPPYKIKPGTDVCDGQFTDEIDCNQLLVQPNFSIPSLEVADVISGGNLTSGTYQFAIQYCDSIGSGYTSYYSVTNPTPIFNPQVITLDFSYPVGKSIVLKINNIDISGYFQYFNLAVIKTINNITSVELVGTYFIDNSDKEIIFSGQNVEQIRLTVDDIFEKFPYYEKADDITAVQDILVWKGMTSIDRINYQKIANKITLQWETWRIPNTETYADEINSTNLRGYLRDEIYPFEIVFLLKNGKQTDSFHIPGRAISYYDLSFPDVPNTNPDFIGQGTSAPYWKIYNTGLKIGDSPGKSSDPSYKGPWEYGDFAYWESTETYPCNENVWGELANQPIRHHKFPDVLVSPIFENPVITYNPDGTYAPVMVKDAIFPIGVRVDTQQVINLIATSDLSQEQKDNIAGFKIVRGDRSTNKSIVAKGMLRNVGKYTREGIEYFYPNYPYNDLNTDPFLLENNNAYNSICNTYSVTVTSTGQLQYTDCFSGEIAVKNITNGDVFNQCSITEPIGVNGGAVTISNLTSSTYKLQTFGVTNLGPIAIIYTSPTAGASVIYIGEQDTIYIDSTTTPVIAVNPSDAPCSITEVNQSLNSQCYPANLNGFTTTDSQYRWVFNSPETSFGQPFLGNILKLESAIFGAGKAHFVKVKDHAKYKLISLEAQQDALQSSMDIAAITGTPDAGVFFAAYQAYLTIYLNGITRRNYTYSFNSIASYDYYSNIDNNIGVKQRYIDIAQYLISGVQSTGDIHPINNWNRESSVYLRTDLTKTSLPYANKTPSLIIGPNSLISDNSRFTLSQKGNCAIPEKEEDISTVSYYSSIKNDILNQWGQIYSFDTIDTGFQISIDKAGAKYTVFGGDTFIGRFSYKTKLAFFIDNRVNAPDDSDIFYDELGNIAYPKYWYSARPILSDASVSLGSTVTLKNFFSVKATSFDCPNSQLEPPTPNPSRTYYDGKMYLFAYGIPTFYCESAINIDLRQAFNNREGDFYPHVSTGIPDDWVQESFVPIAQDNTYYYNVTYSKQNKENFFSHLPVDWESKLCFTNFPFRAIYSDAQQNYTDNTVNSWLIYRPISFFDFPQNYGKLTSIDGIQNKAILARFENKSLLYNTLLTIDTSNPQAAYMGNSSLFRSSPPIDFAETDLGYVGSQHKFLLKIPQGQISVDAKRGQIFLISGNQAVDLSAFGSGVNRFLTDHLAFEILRWFPTANVDNHFKGLGLHGVYDSKYDRVIITKLDYIPKEGKDVKYDEELQSFYIEEKLGNSTLRKYVELTDIEYFCNKSWTLSYNMNTKSWISFHSYIPNWYIAENNFFYSGINDACEFEAIVATIESPFTTSTTTTNPLRPPETTRTTTTQFIDCDIDGNATEIDCTLEGTAIEVIGCLNVNGEFNENLDGWTLGGSDPWIWSSYNGGSAAYNGSDAGGWIGQDILEIGKTYRIEMDVEIIDGECGPSQSRIDIYAGDTNTGWIDTYGSYHVDVTLTCTNNTTFKINGYDNCRFVGVNYIFVDNVCVTEVIV